MKSRILKTLAGVAAFAALSVTLASAEIKIKTPTGCVPVTRHYSAGQTGLNGNTCSTSTGGCTCTALQCDGIPPAGKYYRNIRCFANPG